MDDGSNRRRSKAAFSNISGVVRTGQILHPRYAFNEVPIGNPHSSNTTRSALKII